jgi:hypothetical protein
MCGSLAAATVPAVVAEVVHDVGVSVYPARRNSQGYEIINGRIWRYGAANPQDLGPFNHNGRIVDSLALTVVRRAHLESDRVVLCNERPVLRQKHQWGNDRRACQPSEGCHNGIILLNQNSSLAPNMIQRLLDCRLAGTAVLEMTPKPTALPVSEPAPALKFA